MWYLLRDILGACVSLFRSHKYEKLLNKLSVSGISNNDKEARRESLGGIIQEAQKPDRKPSMSEKKEAL